MKLERPLAFFDTETTGPNPVTDRIVSLAIIKIYPNGNKEERNILLDPECPIPAGATEVHGITDEMVKGQPKFRQVACGVFDFIADCDLGGYNITGFDVPLLCEEFERYNAYAKKLIAAGSVKRILEFPIPGQLYVDSCVIFKKKEERTLSAAVQFYLKKELEGAHGAMADTKAALEVFQAQLKEYFDLSEMQTVKQVADFCQYDGPKRIDLKGVFLIDADGDAIFGNGKHKGAKCNTHKGYIHWMLSDKGREHYTQNTLKVAQNIYDGIK